MRKWQKHRNYRIKKTLNDKGEIIRREYIITVDGKDIEVDADVFKAYSQADRRERYLEERDKGRLLSFERMKSEFNDSMLIHLGEGIGYMESAEDTVINEILAEKMVEALKRLEPDEKELLVRHYFDGVSTRRIANEQGVCQRTVIYRRDKVIEKLRLLMGIKKFL